jgi:phenylalanine-4-hydroxylase
MRTRYRIDDFQQTYFVIRDLDELLELARVDFAPHYERVRGQPAWDAGVLVPGDAVIAQGDGSYHRERMRS